MRNAEAHLADHVHGMSSARADCLHLQLLMCHIRSAAQTIIAPIIARRRRLGWHLPVHELPQQIAPFALEGAVVEPGRVERGLD